MIDVLNWSLVHPVAAWLWAFSLCLIAGTLRGKG